VFFHTKKAALISMFLILLFSAAFFLTGCSQDEEGYAIAVFIPGVTEGSPTYKMLADGVLEAAATDEGARASVIEGGFNQGEWLEKVKALAASGEWDLIVTSNPALPQICDAVSKEFPAQKFLILDGHLEGNSSIYTLRYHQMEQGYLAGTMAGLVTASEMKGASPALSVGMVVGQEFPDMNQAIRPGFERGVETTAPGAETAFRVVGNWFDAAKASELAGDLYDSGADVILTIAGGANQGVISAARERGRYVIWFDTNGYDIAPGIVIGSTAIHQQKAAYEKTLLAIEGKLPFGTAEAATVAGGWISFVEDDPLYLEHVPEAIRQKQGTILENLRQGKPKLPLSAE
jgi:riboflavin transport system substrate-binding protein